MSPSNCSFRLGLAAVVVLWAWAAGLRSFACDSPTCCCRRPDAVTCMRKGEWFVANSPNFQVCSLKSDAEARRVTLHCECLRNRLAATWNEAATTTTWAPRCQVVLHPNLRSYVSAVGSAGKTTLGSSLASPTRGALRFRRIDLRTDVDDVLAAALPHELCHLVLADRFRESSAPLWFDEGVALQYDPLAKRALHERDLKAGLRRGIEFSIVELMERGDYPPADRWGVFYGQSGSLVRFLLAKGTPEQLLEFAVRSRQFGVNFAWRETYHLAGVSALQGMWERQAAPLSAELSMELPLPAPKTSRVAVR